MASRTASAVAFVLISALSAASAQDSGLGCFIPGECSGGSIAGISTGVDTAKSCNDLCKDSATCQVV